MSWVSLITTGLKLISTLMSWADRRQLLDAGQDRAVAKQALAILEATKEGKRLREKVRQLGDDEATQLWEEMIRQ